MLSNLVFAFWPSTDALSFGCSKLFQILLPLGVFVAIQELPGFRSLVRRLLARLCPAVEPQRAEAIFNMLVGFASWKIGCDFGFLIVNRAAAPWSIAFTFAGLVPYAILQYLVYYLLGSKMLIQGKINPFDDRPPEPAPKPRRWWQRFIAKFCHEDGNATTDDVPLRKVALKPLVDYGSILITWPLYNVGLLFLQSGELNFAPFVRFNFLSIFAFYVVNVFGYILGYNLGEWLYQQYCRLRDRFRVAATVPQPQTHLRAFCQRHGLNGHWFVSSVFGVIAVILIEPYLAGAIFAASDRIQHAWFYAFGRVEGAPVAQVLAATGKAGSSNLPNAEALIAGFPQEWVALQLDGPRIADARDFIESSP